MISIKKISCMILTMIMVLAMASAAYAECRWNVNTVSIKAEWDNTDSKVTLQLYKGDSYKVGKKIRVSKGTDTHDFTELIRNTGPGSYKFSVTDEAGRTRESEEMLQVDENFFENLQTNKWSYENRVWLLKNYKGEILKGWQFVNGKWYYLDPVTGACWLNTVTPDGYHVDENGAWDGYPSK